MTATRMTCVLVAFSVTACKTDVPPTLPAIVAQVADSSATDSLTDVAADSTSIGNVASTDLERLTAEIAELKSLLIGRQAGSAITGADSVAATEDPNASTIVDGAAGTVRYLGIRVFWAMVVLVIAYYLISISVLILDSLAERLTTRRLFIKRLVPVVRLLVWSFSIYYVITGVFRVDRTSLIAAAAAVGVAIGLAAQDVLKNIFGGIIIILDRPFQVGDKIRVDDTYGEVVSIGLRATRIVTPDDNLVSVPNLKVVEGQVANANAGALNCQVVVELLLPGWVDATEAKAIAYDTAVSSRYVFLDKPVVVNVRDEFKETFLTRLMVKAYVFDTRHEFALASDITETAKAEFRRRGFIPALSAMTPMSEAS